MLGPGHYIMLRTWEGDAVFAWRRFFDASGQRGVNCAIFRNESRHLSSDLIRQADAIADFCWPGLRHYTYVNAGRIRSTNPGACFKAAGWRKCGATKKGLVILEIDPSDQWKCNACGTVYDTEAEAAGCPCPMHTHARTRVKRPNHY